MILYGDNLIKKIRNEFDNATKRIWIAVPFIGSWSAVKKIMGTKWLNNNNLNIKLITDIRNEGFIDSKTIKYFLQKAEVKTLTGLHAKIYIIDNSVFITSANLTRTAFSKRYEICEYFKITDEHDILKVFVEWWNISEKVDSKWQPTKSNIAKQSDNDAGNTNGLKHLWNLPKIEIENNVTFWLKPFGDSKNPISKTEKIDKKERELNFAKRPRSLKIGDIVICYAVGHQNILSIFKVKSDFKDYGSGRWRYYVIGENLTPNYGKEWFKHGIRFTDEWNSILSQKLFNLNKSNSYGCLMQGSCKLEITAEFGKYLYDKIKKIDDEINTEQ